MTAHLSIASLRALYTGGHFAFYPRPGKASVPLIGHSVRGVTVTVTGNLLLVSDPETQVGSASSLSQVNTLSPPTLLQLAVIWKGLFMIQEWVKSLGDWQEQLGQVRSRYHTPLGVIWSFFFHFTTAYRYFLDHIWANSVGLWFAFPFRQLISLGLVEIKLS